MAKLVIMIAAPKPTDGMTGSASGGMDANSGMDGGGSATASIPLTSLAKDGTDPQVGDTVDCQIEAIVKDVASGNATLDIKSVDGNAVGSSGGPQNSGTSPGTNYGSTSSMGANLRKKAQALDAGSGGY